MDTLRDMLRLMLVPGLGTVRLTRLLDTFGSAAGVLKADFEELARVKGISGPVLQALARKHWNDSEVERQLEVLETIGARPVYRWQNEYPVYLAQLYDAPSLLFVRGKVEHLNRPCLAVVGTRGPSLYGREMVRKLSEGLAAAGFTIVSGLARGIDSLAHVAALDAGGTTVAVLGCGADRIYPAENQKLAERIIEQGCLVSEYLMGTPPEGKNFPRRNRILSGISLGALVVEAGATSGALITANLALEQNREVLAVPGSILSPASQGTNRLIQEGAKLVRDYRDILEELNLGAVAQQIEMKEILPASDTESLLLKQLTTEPVHIDEVCRSSGLPVSTVSSTLAMMELKGLVKSTGNMQYVLAREARQEYRVKVD